MENQMSQGLYDQIANNENGKIEDNVQLYSAKLYFYKLQKPYAIEKGKERYDNIVIGDTHKNVMLINDNDECSVVLDGYIGQWEQSLEMSDRTFDTKEFSQKIKRQVVLDGDLEWTQDGTWIMSVNKPFTKDSKLDDFWVVSSMQREFGWRNGEPNFEGDEYYNPIRHDGASILYLLQISEFNTLNGNALIVNWGEPIYLKEDDKEWNLKEILIKGNWNNTAFHSIELQGMNKLYGKVMNSNLQVEKLPFLINPISLENISKFWSMWFSDKVLPFGLVQDFVREENLQGHSLNSLLKMTPHETDILFDSNVDGKAKIKIADIGFEIQTTTVDGKLNDGGTTFTLHSPWDEPTYKIKKFPINNKSTTDIVEFYAHDGNAGSFAYRWQGGTYNEDRRNNWSFIWGSYEHEDAVIWIYKMIPQYGNIVIQKESTGEELVFNNGAIYEFDLEINGKNEHYNLENEEDKKSLLIYFYRHWTVRSDEPDRTNLNQYRFLKWFGGQNIGHEKKLINAKLNDDYGNIIIKGTMYNDESRLVKLLKQLIEFTWYYKKGFPWARFDEFGKPLNMSAMIKNKFTNSNYAPNQVITNLIEDYKMEYPADLKTEQWRNFMAILPMLGSYILCDYCIDGGLNDQHKAILPWYLELRSSLGRINEWVDDKGTGLDYINIDGSSKKFEELKLQENEGITSAWYKADLDVYLRSEFFDFERKDESNVVIKNKFHNIDRQPNITVGTLQRTYPTFDSEMAESDISTIPYNMNLSDDYLRYMFNLFIPKDMKLQAFIGVIGAGQNYNANFTKTDFFGLTTFFEDETPNLSLKVMDNVVPTQFDLKGLFGNELEFEFIFENEPNDDGEQEPNKSFSFTSKIFNDNDDRICRTSFLI